MSLAYFTVIAAILFTTCGQLLVKSGATSGARFLGSFMNIRTLCGYALIAIAALFSIYAMRQIELKIVTACFSSVVPLVAISSTLLYKEKMNLRIGLGTVIVVLGLLIFSLGG